jgi:chaperonin GroES
LTLQPLGDKVVVKRFEAASKTAGGILLPDNAKDKPQRGEVVSVGPGKQLKDGTRKGLQVKAGDKVVFTAWAGNEYKDNATSTEFVIMSEEEILAVIG